MKYYIYAFTEKPRSIWGYKEDEEHLVGEIDMPEYDLSGSDYHSFSKNYDEIESKISKWLALSDQKLIEISTLNGSFTGEYKKKKIYYTWSKADMFNFQGISFSNLSKITKEFPMDEPSDLVYYARFVYKNELI